MPLAILIFRHFFGGGYFLVVTFLLVGMIWFFGVDVFNKKLKPSATSGRRPVCMCGFNKCSPENTFPQGLQSKLARDHLFFCLFFYDCPARDHQVFFALTEKHIGGSLS